MKLYKRLAFNTMSVFEHYAIHFFDNGYVIQVTKHWVNDKWEWKSEVKNNLGRYHDEATHSNPTEVNRYMEELTALDALELSVMD